MESVGESPRVMPRHQKLQLRLTDAIIDLCRREAFYIEELRIEGTVCVVSDCSSVLVAQITEQIGNHGNTEVTGSEHLPYLNEEQASNSNRHEMKASDAEKNCKDELNEQYQPKTIPTSLNKRSGRYKCPFCNKSYTFKHSLKDHLNLHNGRKPHICKLCLTSFAQLGSMCTHMKREHRHQLYGPRVCCSCHSKVDTTTSPNPPNVWAPDSPSTTGVQLNNNNNNKPPPDNSDSIRPRPNSKPMDIDQIPFVQETLKNLKQELDDTTTTGTAAVINEKDSDSILEVRNFLQQFEGGKDEGGSNHDTMHQVSTRGSEESTLAGRGMGPGGELAQALGLATSEQNMATRAENISNMNLTQSSVPQCFPNATLEMLAHMAQVPHVQQPFPTISELTQVLSAQRQQQPAVAAATPLFRMPPTHSLQRSADGKFQCPFCVKTYNFKHTLKDHINKHLGNRPHVCKHCGDAFTHLASLCAHIKRRHDNQMTSDYQCELCREKFMNLQSLKQHFTWRHKDVKFSPQQFLESAHGVVQEGKTESILPPPSPTQVYPAGVNTCVPHVIPTDTTSTTVINTLTTQNNVTSISHQTASTATTSSILTTSTGVILPQSLAYMATSLPTMTLPTTRLSDQCLYSPERVNELLQKKSRDDSTTSTPPSNNQPQFPGAFVYPGCHDNSRLEGAAPLPPLTPTSPVQLHPTEEEGLSFTTHIADYFSEVNLQTEQGLYKYKCKVCGNLFKIRNSLYEHLNSHLGRKPYVCGTCGDSFTHHSSLHNHARNKHSLQSRQQREALYRHTCPGCKKKFRFPSELDRHFKTNPDHDIRQASNSMV